MSKGSNDDFANGLGGMIAVIIFVCFIGSIILKVLSAIFTAISELFALLFYFITVDVVPFLIFTAVFVFILLVSARLLGSIGKSMNGDYSSRQSPQRDYGKDSEQESRFINRKYDFRATIFVFPLLIWALYAGLGFPSRVYLPLREVTIEKNQKGKILSEVESKDVKWVIESQQIHNAHEKIKVFFGINKQEIERQKESGKKDVPRAPYDRADFAWIVWISLLLGAPGVAFFFALSFGERDVEDAVREIEAPLRAEIGDVSGRLSDTQRKLNSAHSTIRARDEEITRLQARDEFLTKREKEKASITDGILTSDKL